MHGDNEEVREVLHLNPGGNERKARMKLMLATGRKKYNEKAQSNFQVPRRPLINKKKKVSDYRNCPKCGGPFVKKRLPAHVKTCANLDNVRGTVNLKFLGNCQVLSCHERATTLTQRAFSHMCGDEISNIIVHDLLLVLYCNIRTAKYVFGKNRSIKMINGQLRVLGRLLLFVKSVNSNVRQFSDILCSQNYVFFNKVSITSQVSMKMKACTLTHSTLRS